MNRTEMIIKLIQDFKTMNPDANRATIMCLHETLAGLEDTDLELLVGQLKDTPNG